MIEVRLYLTNDDRFSIRDINNTSYSNCARKSDAKKILSKNKDLVLVEDFTIIEDDKNEDLTMIEDDKNYKDFIVNHSTGLINHKSKLFYEFCKHFNLKISSRGRNRTFDRTLDLMFTDGLVTKSDNKKRNFYLKDNL